MAEFRGMAVEKGIYLLDAFMGGVPDFTAVYAVQGSSGIALIDSAVSGSVDSILAGLRFLELDPDDVRYLVISHLHLDHAGGAGFLLPVLRNAVVVADEVALPHLAEPVRLVESARRALGQFAPLYGDMAPIPPERLVRAEEDMELDLGGRKLRLFYCPGHARTQWCMVDDASGGLFPGDAMGMYLPRGPWVCPTTPLPDFDLNALEATLVRLRDLNTPATFFPHFGPGAGSRTSAAQALEGLSAMVDIVREGLREGWERSRMLQMMQDIYPAEDDRDKAQIYGNMQLNLAGLTRVLGGSS